MDTCNATIEVGGETVGCQLGAGGHRSHGGSTDHTSFYVEWEDHAPSATPHRDPEPTYVAEPFEGGPVWQVVREGSDLAAAKFFPDEHPDPDGAAEAEARRLVCHPHDGDESLHGAWVCDSCGVEVDRDPSIISSAELERDEARRENAALREWVDAVCADEKQAREQRDEARAQRNAAQDPESVAVTELQASQREAARYRRRLEWFACEVGEGNHPCCHARRVLDATERP